MYLSIFEDHADYALHITNRQKYGGKKIITEKTWVISASGLKRSKKDKSRYFGKDFRQAVFSPKKFLVLEISAFVFFRFFSVHWLILPSFSCFNLLTMEFAIRFILSRYNK